MAQTGQPIYDVSFAGATITLSGGMGMPGKITDFMDDANPVEFPDVEVTGAGANLNGNMIRYAKPNLVMMSITVIPFSEDDNALYNAWARYRVQNGNQGTAWEQGITCIIDTSQSARAGSRTLSNGTMISGPGGPASTAEGKMQGRTYTFAFQAVS